VWLYSFGLIELVLFMWIFGGKRAWREINRGGIIRVPRIFYYIIRYVTPAYLMILIGVWGYSYLPAYLKEKGPDVWLRMRRLLNINRF